MARFPCTSEPLLTWLPLHLVEVKAWRPTGLPWHGLIGALQTVVLLPLLSGIAPRTTLSLSASFALWRLMSKGRRRSGILTAGSWYFGLLPAPPNASLQRSTRSTRREAAQRNSAKAAPCDADLLVDFAHLRARFDFSNGRHTETSRVEVDHAQEAGRVFLLSFAFHHFISAMYRMKKGVSTSVVYSESRVPPSWLHYRHTRIRWTIHNMGSKGFQSTRLLLAKRLHYSAIPRDCRL
ncbi:hypothetical protein LY78DRAFT_471590 [Colletotrichum sublineola]|nr:hypothetical protein LY78DRAFT_471590 [Colletotrichum sublineola]